MGVISAYRERSEPTPATVEFWTHLERDDWHAAIGLLAGNWKEIWYAADLADLRGVLEAAPRDLVLRHANVRYLGVLLAVDLGGGDATGPDEAQPHTGWLDHIAQRVADLRLAGRPVAAMSQIAAAGDDVRAASKSLFDGSGGRAAVWAVQAGITALLAGQLPAARGYLTSATTAHRPARFPFVRREAAAKLALAHAVGGTMHDARAWLARAQELPRSRSWVESFVDDSIWLADYMCALACLDLDRAEQMRLERPSPVQHGEFWCIALAAYVEHLVLTGRFSQAIVLCEETEALGLPLPGSDGVPGSAIPDARMAAEGLAGAMSATEGDLTPRGALARRRRLFETGQWEPLTTRAAAEIDAVADGRTRLALQLLRAQAVVHIGRGDAGRRLLLGALEEVFELGLLSVLQHVELKVLEEVEDQRAAQAVELMRARKIVSPMVVPLLDAPLSPAEMDTLRLISLGMTRQQVAERQFVSLNTVKTHLRSAYGKLGARNRHEAIERLDQLGL